jgi:hypothetical protein
MKLIILPGNAGKANDQWLTDSAKAFANGAEDIYSQRYAHWETDQKLIDFDTELQRLSELLQDEEGYVIFGKSAGAMLAIYGVSQGVLKPERCVFVGLPLKWAKDNNFPLSQWLEKFDVPAELFQQSEDKFASFEEVKELLAKLEKANIEIEEIPGSDHAYEDFDLFRERATNFLLKKEREPEDVVEGKEKVRERLPLK